MLLLKLTALQMGCTAASGRAMDRPSSPAVMKGRRRQHTAAGGRRLLTWVIAFLGTAAVQRTAVDAELRLDTAVSSNMVLQHDSARISGVATPGATVTVQTSYGDRRSSTSRPRDGWWAVDLQDGPSAAAPFSVLVEELVCSRLPQTSIHMQRHQL